MKKRIPESWLSAFLDGELAADRAALVVRLAEKHPAVAKRLDELRRVKEAVASLPKAKLAGDNRWRLWQAVLEHPELREARQSALSSSLDNELTPEQSEILERTITDEELRYAGKLAEVRDALRSLPKFVAPKTAIERALEVIACEAVQGRQAVAELHALPVEAAPSGLLEDVVHDVKPLVSAPTFRLFAFRRQGWATGLAAALFTGICLFVYAIPGGRPLGAGWIAFAPEPTTLPETKTPREPRKAVPTPAPQYVHQTKAPTLDDPFDDWGPDVRPVVGKKPELPASLVNLVRPGATFDVPGTKFTFVCLDVKKMAGRVQAVYLKQRNAGGDVRMKEEENGQIISVELKATPSEIAGVLAYLKDAEETAPERLIAEVQVHHPKPKPVEETIHLAPAIGNVRDPIPGIEGARLPPLPPKKEEVAKVPLPELTPLPADMPRQYVLVFRRQDAAPPEPKRG